MKNITISKILLVAILLIAATGCGNNSEKGDSEPLLNEQTDNLVQESNTVKASFEPVKTVIYFEFDGRDISIEEAEKLSQIIDILSQRENLQIIIEGHTDPIGDPEYNLELSRVRAHAVKQHLIERGVDNSVLKLVSHGAKRPIETNSYTHHRRVELTVLEVPPAERFTE